MIVAVNPWKLNCFRISQYLSRSYISILPNFLIYFILYQIESVQLENLLRFVVRNERGLFADEICTFHGQ